ncbi:PTS-dependent dihydroxyacetone kinase phosphotransferase subunit DhaM [Sphaerisporangium aureirubrum]|uniref:PTS-dependent dihydroxyacetone kinase phosphotransferase subunit DhaM n=1 Tax=Sphaerisporangium aureirubrum TaxID=1544736 RepID=A0ABW1NHR0_9ACTN
MTVGIVLVSHSATLAAEAVAMAAQFGGPGVPVAAAGGTDDGRLGTSVDKIAAAIRAVDQGSGVLLIPDLGSAVLTARVLAEPDYIVVADVPFIEGAVAAVVIAATGAGLPAVLAAAEESRIQPKF